jgi:hypothetical protein
MQDIEDCGHLGTKHKGGWCMVRTLRSRRAVHGHEKRWRMMNDACMQGKAQEARGDGLTRASPGRNRRRWANPI